MLSTVNMMSGKGRSPGALSDHQSLLLLYNGTLLRYMDHFITWVRGGANNHRQTLGETNKLGHVSAQTVC